MKTHEVITACNRVLTTARDMATNMERLTTAPTNPTDTAATLELIVRMADVVKSNATKLLDANRATAAPTNGPVSLDQIVAEISR